MGKPLAMRLIIELLYSVSVVFLIIGKQSMYASAELLFFFGVFINGLIFIYTCSRAFVAKDLSYYVTSLIFFMFTIFPFFNSVVYLDRVPLGVVVAVLVSLNMFFIFRSSSNFKILLVPFFFYAIYIILKLQISPNPNDVFLNSKNWISYYLILLIFPYYFFTIANSQRASVFPAVLCFGLSVISLSRSGIISSLLILLLILLYRYKTKTCIYLVSALSVMIFLNINLVNLWETLSTFEINSESRFSLAGFFEDARSSIFLETINHTDAKSLLFGFEGRVLYFTSINDFNPHNSLINAYIGGGLIHLLLILLGLIVTIILSDKFVAFLVIFTFMRTLTDSGSLFVPFDFFFFLPLISIVYYMCNPPRDYQLPFAPSSVASYFRSIMGHVRN